MPPDGVSPDAAGRYPAELNADGTYACAARARLPEDYFPVDGDSFGFTAQAFAIDDADAAIAGSDPANGTLLVPIYPGYDLNGRQKALAVYRDALPGWRVTSLMKPYMIVVNMSQFLTS